MTDEHDLMAELDAAEYCRCGKTHEVCAEDGGCWRTATQAVVGAARTVVRRTRESGSVCNLGVSSAVIELGSALGALDRWRNRYG